MDLRRNNLAWRLPLGKLVSYQGPAKATRRAFREGLRDRAKTQDHKWQTLLMTLARKCTGQGQVRGILCGAMKLASKMT
jgi:hypothetical protein